VKRFSDQEILRNISIDNADAFEYVFLTYYNELCIHAYSILKDKDNAEEIVQEVFVKLWESRMELSIKQSIKAYLYRTVHNQCINYLDHLLVKKKYAAESSENFRDLISPVSADYPIANLIVQELQDKIDQSLLSLPEQCRKVFLLIRHDDLSYKEAAEKLGVSVNTVKTQLQRAISRLRENLKNYLP
jgi:RNA polymerase sigma-70 factor (ECF subfamily)